jgi:uncharacterized metal-binding protein YceD (DUF177 family)
MIFHKEVSIVKTYVIAFKGLKEGKHQFHYEIDSKFFSLFEQSEIEKGNLQIKVTLVKSERVLSFDIQGKGEVTLICDRCLDEYLQKISFKEKLFAEFGETNSDITDVDNILTLSYGEGEIDLSQHIYEYIHLNLPYRRIHPETLTGESTCNKEMLEELNEYIVEETIDPRWEKLKTLLN